MRLRDIADIVRMAVSALGRSPGRSGLTILGLAIGVSAFIAMTSFGEGAKRAVISQFAGLGVHLIKINSLAGDPGAGAKPARPIVMADVEALQRDVTTARRVVPNVRSRVTASTPRASWGSFVYGTTPDYFPLHGWPAALGGLFDDSDLHQRGKVCVLGATVATTLFGNESPLGATINLGDSFTCNVLGVLSTKGLSTSGRDLDDLILVPLTTYEAYIGAPNGYAEVEVEATSARTVPALRGESVGVVRRMHGLRDGEPDDFRLTSPTEAVKAAENVSTIITRLLAAIAAVSLLVGGIGIMNIQLVSVAERTKEIGTRAAIGASPDQILAQFLAEALVLSGVGALLGILVGVGMSFAVAHAMHWSRSIDPLGIAGAAAFGLGAGVIFGYMPAKRAAELDPIEALRHE